MILTSVFRLSALIAGCFLGESGRRKVPSLAAVEPAYIVRVDSPGIWITKNRYSKGRSPFSQNSVLQLFACSTKEYCRGH
ncbi:hypothetical protein FHW68_004051 [Pseudomonas sp. Tn43]|nr:hypothetical protein [Pseudomonas sp. Tn43]PAU51546.1 hypothetical protein BZL43_25510 [Pseudomonas sp. PICF141]